MLSLLRQRYWVIKANFAVGKILTKWYSCRKREATFCEQKMADLPQDHLVPEKQPIYNRWSRLFWSFPHALCLESCQRYEVIFTCMTIHAVHIAIAHSLDTDSFLLALRRFIARRGHVQRLGSELTSQPENVSCVNRFKHGIMTKFMKKCCKEALNGASIPLMDCIIEVFGNGASTRFEEFCALFS